MLFLVGTRFGGSQLLAGLDSFDGLAQSAVRGSWSGLAYFVFFVI